MENGIKIGAALFVVIWMLIGSFSGIGLFVNGNGIDENFNDDSNEELTADSSMRTRASKNSRAEWDSVGLASSRQGVEKVVVGDFISSLSGNEILVSSKNDSSESYIELIRPSGSNWIHEEIIEDDEVIIDIDSGAYLDGTDDEAIVLITKNSGSGEVKGTLQFFKSAGEGTWTDSTLKEFSVVPKLVCSGDIIHTNDAVEIITVSEDNKLFLTLYVSDSGWNTEQFGSLTSNIIDIIISDTDPSEAGNQLIIVDDGGNIIEFTADDKGNWQSSTIWTSTGNTGITAVSVGDADNDGNLEILVGLDDNSLMIIDKNGSGIWESKKVFDDKAKIRNIAVVDIDPFRSGFETVVAGDSMRITALYHSSGAWSGRILYEGTEEISDLYAGMVDASNIAANEIITVNGKEIIKTEFSGYYSEVLYKGENKLSGVGFGDLDPDHAGNEAFVVGMDKENKGIIATAWRDGDEWKDRVLFNGAGELITPVIGNFDGQAGNELAAVGMLFGAEGPGAGQVTMVKKSGSEFVTEQIVEYPRFLHGAAIGEFLTDNEGDELIITSFTDKGVGNVSVVTKEGNEWNTTLVWQSIGNVRKAVFEDIDPTHAGDELFVVDKSGNLTMIYQNESGFYAETLWTDPGTPGLARLAVGDADNDGKIEIVVGGDSKNVGYVEYTDSGWIGKVIFTDINKIRGCAIGDYDFGHPGNEIAVYGYSARVTRLIQDETDSSKWIPKTLFVDEARGHDLAVGEFDPLHEGNELLFSGFSKNMTMLAYHDDVSQPSFRLSADVLTKTVNAEETVTFEVDVESVNNFNERIDIELEIGGGYDKVELKPKSLVGGGKVQFSLTPSSSLAGVHNTFGFVARGGGIERHYTLNLTVNEAKDKFEIIKVVPEHNEHDVDIEDLEIEIEFNRPVNESTVTIENIVIKTDHDEIYTGTFEVSEDKMKVIISHIHEVGDEHAELPGMAVINITITTSVTDTDGNSFETDYHWEFETGESKEHEEPEGFEGMELAAVAIIIIVILMVIIGIVYGRKKIEGDKAEEEEEKEDKT